MNVDENDREIDDMLREEYWSVQKVTKWTGIARFHKRSGNEWGMDDSRHELNLLNRTCIVLSGERDDACRWCLENPNLPFQTWRSHAAEYSRKRVAKTSSPVHKARIAYALWSTVI